MLRSEFLSVICLFASMPEYLVFFFVTVEGCHNHVDDHCFHFSQQSGQLSVGAKAGSREVQRSVRGHKCDKQ